MAISDFFKTVTLIVPVKLNAVLFPAFLTPENDLSDRSSSLLAPLSPIFSVKKGPITPKARKFKPIKAVTEEIEENIEPVSSIPIKRRGE